MRCSSEEKMSEKVTFPHLSYFFLKKRTFNANRGVHFSNFTRSTLSFNLMKIDTRRNFVSNRCGKRLSRPLTACLATAVSCGKVPHSALV